MGNLHFSACLSSLMCSFLERGIGGQAILKQLSTDRTQQTKSDTMLSTAGYAAATFKKSCVARSGSNAKTVPQTHGTIWRTNTQRVIDI